MCGGSRILAGCPGERQLGSRSPMVPHLNLASRANLTNIADFAGSGKALGRLDRPTAPGRRFPVRIRLPRRFAEPPTELGEGDLLHLDTCCGERRDDHDLGGRRRVNGGDTHLSAKLGEFEEDLTGSAATAVFSHFDQVSKVTRPAASY